VSLYFFSFLPDNGELPTCLSELSGKGAPTDSVRPVGGKSILSPYLCHAFIPSNGCRVLQSPHQPYSFAFSWSPAAHLCAAANTTGRPPSLDPRVPFLTSRIIPQLCFELTAKHIRERGYVITATDFHGESSSPGPDVLAKVLSCPQPPPYSKMNFETLPRPRNIDRREVGWVPPH